MNDCDLLIDAGLLVHRQGEVARAATFYRRALSLVPGVTAGMHLAGLARHQMGDPVGAIAWLRRVRLLEAPSATLHHNLGEALRAVDAHSDAAQSYASALMLENWRSESYLGLSLSNLAVGRLQQARQVARFGLVIAPADDRLWSALGVILQHLAKVARSAIALGRALSVAPSDPQHLVNVGGLALSEGRIGIARRLLGRALAVAPTSAEAWANLGGSEISLANPARAAIALSRATQLRPHDASLGSNWLFALNLDPKIRNYSLYAAYRDWERRYASAMYLHAHVHPKPNACKRRLKVGYMSADLRTHPVSFNVLGLLESHDPDAFDVHCYADVGLPDATSRRFMEVATWRSTVGLTDHAIADMIAADRIDIVVALAGHTAGNRVAVCARRPAPLQISFHDLSTSGMAVMDAWFTDDILHPADTTEGFTETLVRLPNFYLHQAPESSPPVPRHRRPSSISFGSFNNPAKLNDDVLGLWADVLVDTPRSTIVLGYGGAAADPVVRNRVTARFVEKGIEADRLIFLDRESDRFRHLERVGAIDIALDPFPFAGSTATFEALWMGVPVVTLLGTRFLGRVGASLLIPLGLGELVAESKEKYRSIAASIARDHNRRNALGGMALRSRLESSAFCDARTYARNVEAQYRRLWRTRCASDQGAK